MVKSITGYSDKISVQAGETIRFMVSCGSRGRIAPSWCASSAATSTRRGPASSCPRGLPDQRHVPGPPPADPQRLLCLRAGRAAARPGGGFTVQAMIWPTTPRLREQVLLSCWSAERGAGFELIIDAGGAAALRLGDGNGGVETVGTGQPLLERAWCFVCASFDPATRRVSVHQRRQVAYARLETGATAERTVAFAPAAAEAPLLMAARLVDTDDRGRRTTEAHYNGRIDSPRLSGRGEVPLDEALALHQRPLPERLRPDLIGGLGVPPLRRRDPHLRARARVALRRRARGARPAAAAGRAGGRLRGDRRAVLRRLALWAGLAPTWAALVEFPLVQYRGFHRALWGQVTPLTAHLAAYTAPRRSPGCRWRCCRSRGARRC